MIGAADERAAPPRRPCGGGRDDPCAPLTLRDGRALVVRPLRIDDAQAEQDFVRALSPLSRYRRFHVGWPEVPARQLLGLVDVDQHDHVALAAWPPGDSRIVAEARRVREASGKVAEFAIAVADDHQRLGLGSALLRRLARHARSQGIVWLRGDVLWDNEPMRALVERLGGRLHARGDEPGVLQAWLRADALALPTRQLARPGAAHARPAASSPPTRSAATRRPSPAS